MLASLRLELGLSKWPVWERGRIGKKKNRKEKKGREGRKGERAMIKLMRSRNVQST